MNIARMYTLLVTCWQIHSVFKVFIIRYSYAVNIVNDLWVLTQYLFSQNRTVMLFGAVCITGCLAFIMYLNATHERTTPSKSIYQKGKTRWDNWIKPCCAYCTCLLCTTVASVLLSSQSHFERLYPRIWSQLIISMYSTQSLHNQVTQILVSKL